MQSVQDNHAFEMSLRDQLIAAQNGQPPPATHAAAQPAEQYPPLPNPNLDPSITRQHISPYGPMSPGNVDAEDEETPSGPAKKSAPKPRELSKTKRAAQNRAAQRAFRQRKEQYIQQLEDDVKNYQSFEDDLRALQADNTALHAYINTLQGQLLAAKIDFEPTPTMARVAQAQPNSSRRPAYDLSESSPLVDPHAQPNTANHRFYTQPSRDFQETRPLAATLANARPSIDQSHEHVPQHEASRQDDLHDDALAPSAINQLRAAAVQAGELDSARSRGQGEGYDTAASDDPRPPKRPRREEETRPSSTGGGGGMIASIVSRLHAITGTTPTKA